MTFFTNRVVLDVSYILRFALDPYDSELFMRIYYKFQTYLKKKQAIELCQISENKKIPILSAVDYVEGVNNMVIGKCHAIVTNLKSMLKEPPSKAIFRIENTMGYREYLERNNIDTNKLFILKQLANNEVSIGSFLVRLDYLQDMLIQRNEDYDNQFIFSTIHSAKGLEYNNVYLLDVCDGVFPGKVPASKASKQEEKDYEEERRLFYVGMTRARDELNIFKIENEKSVFLKELNKTEKKSLKSLKEENIDFDISQDDSLKKITIKREKLMDEYPYETNKKVFSKNYKLIIGERVEQLSLGKGTVTDISYDDKGKINRFTVLYDSGNQKVYGFPMAFNLGMKLTDEK